MEFFISGTCSDAHPPLKQLHPFTARAWFHRSAVAPRFVPLFSVRIADRLTAARSATFIIGVCVKRQQSPVQHLIIAKNTEWAGRRAPWVTRRDWRGGGGTHRHKEDPTTSAAGRTIFFFDGSFGVKIISRSLFWTARAASVVSEQGCRATLLVFVIFLSLASECWVNISIKTDTSANKTFAGTQIRRQPKVTRHS